MAIDDKKPIKVGNFYPPQIKDAKTGKYKELTSDTYNMQSVQTVSVHKQYFEGSGNFTKEFDEDMHGLSIYNGHTEIMRFVIDGVSIPVFEKGSWSDVFKDPFRTVSIIASGPWYVMPLQIIGAAASIVDPEPPDTEAPDNVTNLKVSAATQNSVTLTWDASIAPDTAGYQVWRGGVILTTVTNTTFTDENLTPSTQYTYTIKAIDHAGNVASGTSVNATTEAQPEDDTPPNNVTDLKASNVTQSGCTLTWLASSSDDVKDYRIYKDGTLIATVTGISYNVTGLTANTNYTFTVKARDTSNNEASGTSIPVTTADVPVDLAPEPVTNLTAGTPTSSSIPLTWTRSVSSNVDKYEVSYSVNGVDFTVASGSVNSSSSSYNVTGLAAETTYTLRVVAISATGKRSAAVTVQATTADVPPVDPDDVITVEDGYLVVPLSTYDFIVLTSYENNDFKGWAWSHTVKDKPMFAQEVDETSSKVEGLSYQVWKQNMVGVNEECYTICPSGSLQGYTILWLNKATWGETAAEVNEKIRNTNLHQRLKLATYDTYVISSNISNVTTRTSGVQPGFEYFKCDLNDGVPSEYRPAALPRPGGKQNYASNGVEVMVIPPGYVFSYTKPCLRVNTDNSLEVLLPKGILASVDVAGVKAWLDAANIKIYY